MIKMIMRHSNGARVILQSAGWSVSEMFVLAVVMLIVSPLLFRLLGESQFGLWALAASFSRFSVLTSLGAGMSTMIGIYNVTHNSNNEIVKTIKSGIIIAAFPAVFVFILFWFFSPFVTSVFFPNMGDANVVAHAIFIGSLILLIQHFDEVFVGAWRGMKRYDLASKFEIFGRPFWAIGTILIAYLTKNIIAILWLNMFYCILRLLSRVYVFNKIFGMRMLFVRVPFSLVRKNIVTGFFAAVKSANELIFLGADRFIVGSFFGASDLSRYTICAQLAQTIHSFQGVSMQGLSPLIAKKIPRNLLKISVFSGAFFTIIPFIFLVFGWWGLRILFGENFANENVKMFMVMMAGMVLLGASIPAYFIAIGLKKIKACALIYFVSALAMIGILICFSNIGVMSFVFGQVVYCGTVFLGLLILIKKEARKMGNGDLNA